MLLNIAWLARFRWGFPTEWDESGYLAIGVHDVNALHQHGLVGYLRSVETQAVEAPLVPALAALVFAVFGSGMGQGVAVICGFEVLLLLATFAVGLELMGAWWSVLASAVVGGVPLVIDYARIFHFAVPAAALSTSAVWALMRSDRLGSRRYSILCGALLGLTILARTMAVAYLPAFALAAAFLVVGARGQRHARILNALLAGATTALVAATWYVDNWSSVYTYLSSSGYGATSTHYGASHSLFSSGYWLRVVGDVARGLYLPLACVVLVSLAAGVVVVVTARRGRVLPELVRIVTSKWFVLVVVAAEGYAAMTSSRNDGTAFVLPWLPAVVLLAVAAVSRIPLAPIRVGLVIAMSLAALTNVVSKSGRSIGLAGPTTVSTTGIGPVDVVDARGILEEDVLEPSGYRVAPTARPQPFQREWPQFEQTVVQRVARCAVAEHLAAPTGMVASASQILSNTSFELQAALVRENETFLWLKPYGDTVRAYRTALAPSNVDFVVVAPTPLPDSLPTLARVDRAARSLAFRNVARLRMPDGRVASIWWRHRSRTAAGETRGNC